MIEKLDIRFGSVVSIEPFSKKESSPRRKYCKILVNFPGFETPMQSIGQFARHSGDMVGKTVLCLINLGEKNMFGQPSQILIMGIKHPEGGVIPGDESEAQATYLQPCMPEIEPLIAFPRRENVDYNLWQASDLRMVAITQQFDTHLIVDAGSDVWQIPLAEPLAKNMTGSFVVAAKNSDAEGQGMLPLDVEGKPLLAQPIVNVRAGETIY